MPITALPPTTIRAIGATSVISDPCSVVKELVDNALDASATSIFVDISANTVDLIQVKDNGHGIPSSDHPVVCKRAYTSKIETVEDLREVGSKHLGFRGEALASMAEISGGVTVSTRVDSELVGSSIKYGRDGVPISTQRASHPVGTSVRVVDLFKHIPVRRQTTLRSTVKTLGRVKKLLQAYAIAQPSKRLCFRVLKAKNEKNNFMYAPGPDPTLMDAAIKIVGMEMASACIVKKWPPDEVAVQEVPSEQNTDFVLTAVLLNPDNDIAKSNNAGQHISVDGRPLSSARGLGRDVTKIYKSYIRSACSRKGLVPTITDPVLCLHVKSLEERYDVNIEPAKDDILFEDREQFLSVLKDFMANVYGDYMEMEQKKASPPKGKEPIREGGFGLLLAQTSPQPVRQPRSPDGYQSSRYTPARSSTNPSSGANTTSSVCQSPEQSENNVAVESPPAPGSHSKESQFINPWSITKLNVPVRENGTKGTGSAVVTLSSNHGAPTQRRSQRKQNDHSRKSFPPSPSSTDTSLSNPSPNPRMSSSRVQQSRLTGSPQGQSLRASRDFDRERYGNGALDTIFSRTTQVSLSQSAAEENPDDTQTESSLSRLARGRFGSGDASSSGSSASQGATQDAQCTTSARSHTSPAPEAEPPRSNLLGSSAAPALATTGKRRELPVLEKWSARLHESAKPDQNPELEEALDFEHRKREAIKKHRERIRDRVEPSTPSSSPHLSRYLAARAALHSEPATDEGPSRSTTRPVINPHDPRAYLMRYQSIPRQDDPSRNKNLRRKTTHKLPLERIPNGCDLHDVSLILPTDLSLISTKSNEALASDVYTSNGHDSQAFDGDLQPDLIGLWTRRLSALTKTQYRTENESDSPNLTFDFSALNELVNNND
ncbi:DNA mismatch repair protein [Aspergillus campestris IBT 28561]|uniref:DNA mismatch repair protein n=1 Tax=Aspergillus campestris (strain IBT 28561) TaxID=1392248 RepID=A0A2I1DB60_ASPC2|nr:DNA mismatch repair protein [Aspergillus campestris IBT 28561]PKY07111.1 DNA mismatch repair protein [Aspergillus campestris IBT 28561]